MAPSAGVSCIAVYLIPAHSYSPCIAVKLVLKCILCLPTYIVTEHYATTYHFF